MQEHPFKRLQAPKLPQTIIDTLSDEEIERLIKAIDSNTRLGARGYAIFLLRLDTGIRSSELYTLTPANTHLNEGYIKVLGKGDKERIVPICSATQKAVMRYIHVFRTEPALRETDELFLTDDERPLACGRLAQVIRRLGKKRVGKAYTMP